MHRKFIIVIIFSFSLFFAGVKSEVYLGDESYHYTFAKLIYETGKRVASNPIYANYPKLDYFYSDVPLWHILLASLWWCTGSTSSILAQGYQIIYFLFLAVSCYFLGKKLYGKITGELGMILTLSTPLVGVFTILLYLDVPASAWSVFSLWMFYEKKWILAGIGVGALLLTKINGLLLLPGFLILMYFYYNEKWLDKIKAIVLFGCPIMLINLPEIWFRKSHFGFFYYVAPKYIPKEGPSVMIFEPSSLYIQPTNLFIYFGILIWIGISIYFFNKNFNKKDLFLWIPITTYLLTFLFFFHYSFPIRNLSPILPLIALLGGKGLASLLEKKKKFLIFILILCIVQFTLAVITVYLKRQIPEGIKKGYEYIKTHTFPNAVFFYPEENLVLYTGRPIIWSHLTEMPKLFWQSEGDQIRSILKNYDISYIAIKKDRVYDDKFIKHTGGFPNSFVEKLPAQNFLKLVFNNSEISIWEICF